ncbi:hypothetical protein [Comamonas jiangduensis]|uniref:hypothetical protein n=1 Tax=Comamonas jiangduensis TaxID=1194168 RepID=UPI0028B25D97|nr:hypothetical protein [Comamonas jiangduensis]
MKETVMSMPVPELIANPYPQRLLIPFLQMMLRYERVQKQLQELEDCFSRADEAFRDAVFWGGCAAAQEKHNAFNHIRELGFLPLVVPGSPMWQAAAEGATA